jgi:hypothetical protein
VLKIGGVELSTADEELRTSVVEFWDNDELLSMDVVEFWTVGNVLTMDVDVVESCAAGDVLMIDEVAL